MVSAVRGTPLRMDIIPRLAVRREGLQLLMLEHEPDIMHFSMHGIQDHLAAGKRAPENPRDLTPAERLVFSGGDIWCNGKASARRRTYDEDQKDPVPG